MNDKEFLQNVTKLVDMLLKNAAHSFGLDFMVINDTAIEAKKRLQKLGE